MCSSTTEAPTPTENPSFDLTSSVIQRAYPLLSIPVKTYTDFLAVTDSGVILTTAEGTWNLPFEKGDEEVRVPLRGINFVVVF